MTTETSALDDVPADVLMELTPELDRAFKAAGCDPTCHVCGEAIAIGKKFQLVSYHGDDQMTCSKKRCGRSGLEKQHEKKLKEGYSYSDGTDGRWKGYHRPVHKGYSRPSKGRGG